LDAALEVVGMKFRKRYQFAKKRALERFLKM